jgi:hypothetical protein
MRTLLVVSLLSGWLAAGEAPGPARFFFLSTVNNAGYIDVCGCKQKKVKQGSLSRRSTIIKTLRAQGKPFVLLDGGSCLFPIQDNTPKDFEKNQMLSKAFVIVESMNRMGYQAMAVGTSDLLLGLDTLKSVAERARFPFLSANFLGPDGKRVFPASAVVEVAGVRVGIIGLIIGTLNPRYLEKLAPGCRVVDPVQAAKDIVAQQKGSVDIFVALSHVRKEENEALGAQVPEIGIIFDPNINFGNHSIFLPDPLSSVDRYAKALVVRADGEGMRIARVDVEFEVPFGEVRNAPAANRLDPGVMADPIPPDLAAVLGPGPSNRAAVSRISVEPHFLSDPDIEALVNQWKKQDTGPLDPKILAEMKSAPIKFVGKEACKSCHEEQYKFWQGTAHAKAFQSLRETGDHLRYDCIGCHTVGFGHSFFDVKDGAKWADVQCECCHGSNPKHVEDPEKSPPWETIVEATCLRCHNEHQIRVPFDFSRTVRSVSCPAMKKP